MGVDGSHLSRPSTHLYRIGAISTLFRTETLGAGAWMPKLKLLRDIQPVTEFRAKAAQFIEQVQETRVPVVLTQHGRSAAVLMDVESYEAMVEELALLRDVRLAEEQIAAGQVRSHSAAAKTLRARLRR
jgi:prevent-host-death family protein